MHTSAAMTPVDINKIIINPLIPIIFIALNASVCLLPSFLIYVELKKLIIDGASAVMSMLNALHREQPNCTSQVSSGYSYIYMSFQK
jgi:hypothetical protein